MNSIKLLRKLIGLLAELSDEDLILPLRVNHKPVDFAMFSLTYKDGEKYINLEIYD